ncbi:hypothetical protein UA08_00534 [Talaromyces atroroseus]|uniref:Uncharacterized protein n=1 Tax=Talaromyces atroroseus TaxID=1441469 RepID=A0A225BDS8_TALAT|nr:hypothetical protein UA08_00534 [Talaromyces atroroseus]OKL64177.1 hypothetical protein UA08_00534 [Talaromyces atroroseus]
MLAFLEFRIGQGELDRVRNVEAIAQHLWQDRSRRLTSSQVEDKLKEIQSQTTRKRRRGTIFTEGLRVLSDYPHEGHVRRLKQQLDDEYVMHMHSQDRVTRSTSRGLGSSQPQARKRTEIPESPSPGRLLSTKKPRFHLSPRQSPLARRNQLAGQSSHTAPNRTLSPKHEEGDRETPIPPNPTIRVMVPDSTDMSTDDDPLSPVPQSDGASLNLNATSASNSGWCKRPKQSLDSIFSESKMKSLEEEVKDLKEELTRLRKDREHLGSQMHTINSSLETSLRECQRRCAQYADDVKCLNYALSENNPAERKLLYQQERQIETLRHSLSERRQNAEFSRLSADEHHVPKPDDIQEAIYAIHYETKKILLSYDDNLTVRTPDLDHEDNLRSLLGKSLGISFSSPIHCDTLKVVLEKNGLQAIICALIAAALSHIKHSDYYLNHVIPARAKELASMLSDALAPLIPKARELPRRSTEGFHTWGEGVKESARREKRLTDIFKRALRLKGDLLSSTGLFSLVLHCHGKCFDKRSMIAETKHGDSAVMSSKTSESIQACLLPAIYVQQLPRQGVVDYKLDILGEDPEVPDFCLISKAIVVLD